MSQNIGEEVYTALVKTTLFIIGLFVGLAAKLATLHQKEKITWKVVFYQSTVSFAAAWFVFWFCKTIHQENIATGASVIVGRFADSILLLIWTWFKRWFRNAADDLENDQN